MCTEVKRSSKNCYLLSQRNHLQLIEVYLCHYLKKINYSIKISFFLNLFEINYTSFVFILFIAFHSSAKYILLKAIELKNLLEYAKI